MPLSNIFRKKSNPQSPHRSSSIFSRCSSKTSTHSLAYRNTPVPEQPAVYVSPSFPFPADTVSTSTATSPAISVAKISGVTYGDAPPSYRAATSTAAPATAAPPFFDSYPARSLSPTSSANSVSNPDDPYAFLSTFDTAFLIDDSGSMAGCSWAETSAALAAIAPICAAHDADGVDVYFMNTPESAQHKNLRSAGDVQRVFRSTRPRGATPTGASLDRILKPYLRECERKGCEALKPLNVIVITDGVATDDPESVIVAVAKKLEKLEAPSWQVGVQFFQVGKEPGAAEALRELDDGLVEMGCPRDIVDTVPWRGELSAQGVLKVVLGAVNRRLDRRRASGESAR